MESDSDSYSSPYLTNIMKNDDNNFFKQNEFLRENRRTNDTSNQSFFSEEEKPLEPFSDLNIKKMHSDDFDLSNLFYKSQNNQNREKKSENLNPIVNTMNKSKELEVNKEIDKIIPTTPLLFTVFQKSHRGRISNELKENSNYQHNPKHSKHVLDNFKIKVIRSCIKYISLLIYDICLSLGKEYKINMLNNNKKISSKKYTLYLCDKTMLDLFINNFSKRNSKSKDMEKKYKNKSIYNSLIANGKLAQSPLLTRIFEMTFGEILFKFINNDNFAKKIDPNFSFTTFSDVFSTKEYPEVLQENLQESFRDLLSKYIF